MAVTRKQNMGDGRVPLQHPLLILGGLSSKADEQFGLISFALFNLSKLAAISKQIGKGAHLSFLGSRSTPSAVIFYLGTSVPTLLLSKRGCIV